MFGATSDKNWRIARPAGDLDDENIDTCEMRENISSEVMKKSCKNADAIISGGPRRVFNSFFETINDTIGGQNEFLVKENSQIRKK